MDRILKMKQERDRKNLTKKLGADGMLQDVVEHQNGTYRKVWQCDKFYVYFNEALGSSETIDMNWKSFPSNESFGSKPYDFCFSSEKMLLKKFPDIRI